MKYLHLIWASLFRRKTRTILTLVSIVAAFLLFGLLDAVRTSFAQAGQSANGAQRLQKHRLPHRLDEICGKSRIAHAPRIAALPPRRQHEQPRRAHIRVGFDLASERFAVHLWHRIVENREIERIAAAVRRAQKFQRFLPRAAIGIANLPVPEQFAQANAWLSYVVCSMVAAATLSSSNLTARERCCRLG